MSFPGTLPNCQRTELVVDLGAAIDREITRWWASWPPLPQALSQGACTDPRIPLELFFPQAEGTRPADRHTRSAVAARSAKRVWTGRCAPASSTASGAGPDPRPGVTCGPRAPRTRRDQNPPTRQCDTPLDSGGDYPTSFHAGHSPRPPAHKSGASPATRPGAGPVDPHPTPIRSAHNPKPLRRTSLAAAMITASTTRDSYRECSHAPTSPPRLTPAHRPHQERTTA